MVRLIDANALREVMEFHPTSVSVCATFEEAKGRTKQKLECLEDIDNAPTIDAIPVEWLRKWPKDLREGAYVRDILTDWQQEQEAR